MGLEPMTSSLPRKCSTTELQQRAWLPSRRAEPKRVPRGAGDGNRTHVCSLEGCRSTIELRPQFVRSMRTTPASRAAMPTAPAGRAAMPTAPASRAAMPSAPAGRAVGANQARLTRALGPRRRTVRGRTGQDATRSCRGARVARTNRTVGSSLGRRTTSGAAGPRPWWWWGEADSNRRRLSHQIYSLARLAAPESPLRRARESATRAIPREVLVLGSKRFAVRRGRVRATAQLPESSSM